jgi:hypothetical protein
MNTSWFEKLTVMGMPALVVLLVVSLLISGLVLSVMFRMFLGYMPSYVRSISVVLLTAVTAAAVHVVANMVVPGHLVVWLALLAAWLLGAGWLNSRLLTRTGSAIGYGKACLIQLAYLMISLLLWMVFVATLAA